MLPAIPSASSRTWCRQIPQYWFVVNAGDTAFSDVFYTVSQAKWTLVISDQTTGDYHSEVHYKQGRASTLTGGLAQWGVLG